MRHVGVTKQSTYQGIPPSPFLIPPPIYCGTRPGVSYDRRLLNAALRVKEGRLPGGASRPIVQGSPTLLQRPNQKRNGCRRSSASAAASAPGVSMLTQRAEVTKP